MFRCECQAGKPTPEHVRWSKRLRDELGAYVEKTFRTFDLDRTLDELELDGQHIEIELQRDALRDAYMESLAFARTLDGGLCLHGTRGSGKSHLGCAIANDAGSRGVVVAYASAPRLLDWIKGGYKDNSASERTETLIQSELLVLDDLGTESATSANASILFDIVNERTRFQRATVFTSNIDPNALPYRLSDRIYELTRTDARIRWMPVSSYRRIGRDT